MTVTWVKRAGVCGGEFLEHGGQVWAMDFRRVRAAEAHHCSISSPVDAYLECRCTWWCVDQEKLCTLLVVLMGRL